MLKICSYTNSSFEVNL